MRTSKLILIFFCLDSSSLSGYLSNVSPVQTSKDLKRKYFNSTLTDDANNHRGVCFSPKKYKLFISIEDKQSSSSSIELTKSKVSENDNIIVNDFTSANKQTSFLRKKTPKSFPLSQ